MSTRDCRNRVDLPGEVVKVLEIFKTKHLLQLPLSPPVSGGADEIDMLHHAVDVSAAVRRHAFLDGDKIAPLYVSALHVTLSVIAYIVVDSFDWRAGSMISPEGPGRCRFGPGGQCAAVGPSGQHPGLRLLATSCSRFC